MVSKRTRRGPPAGPRRSLVGTRPIAKEPLTKEDWRLVYYATLLYKMQIEAIVMDARRRAGEVT